MPRNARLPPVLLMVLTLGPAFMVGATLWIAGGLVPACVVSEQARLAAPDGRFDLVVFSRHCGETEANTQAALVPSREEIPFDAASFYSIAAAADLRPAWIDIGHLELTPPDGVPALRADDSVAGITVTYR